MHTGIDCLACFMRQALNAVKLSTQDEEERKRILIGASRLYDTFSMDRSSPENVVHIYRYIAEMTGAKDPFSQIKKQSNDFALALVPKVETAINRSTDPLRAAVQFAITANVLDSGAQNQLDIHQALETCLGTPFAVDHYARFETRLAQSKKVLYLADNCGELVFDKLLIRRLLDMGLEVTLGVRGLPTINDATMADARYCGIHRLCPVIPNGSDIAGTVIDQCTSEFRDAYDTADCIISKGMGNYETLSDAAGPLFFLFTIKCSTVLDYVRARHDSPAIDIGSPVVISAR